MDDWTPKEEPGIELIMEVCRLQKDNPNLATMALLQYAIQRQLVELEKLSKELTKRGLKNA